MAKWFGLIKTVEIESGRSVWEVQQALAAITRGGLKLVGRRKTIFTGWIRGDEGKLWLGRSYCSGFGLRFLRFRLVPTDGGCRLEGKLKPILPAKLFLGFWFFPIVLIGGRSVFHWANHHPVDIEAAFFPFLLFVLMGACYTAFAFWMGRNAEALALKAIKHILADERSAAVVVDLLTLGK